jgi:nucleotide-binding universal stress UspA family protein
MFTKILVASDGSDGSKRAMKAAIDMAAKYEADLEVISIIEKLPKFATSISEARMIEEREREHFEQIHRSAQIAAARERLDLASRIVVGHEVATLVEHARAGRFDLLVVGRQGNSSIGGVRTGATARALAEEAPCALLMV